MLPTLVGCALALGLAAFVFVRWLGPDPSTFLSPEGAQAYRELLAADSVAGPNAIGFGAVISKDYLNFTRLSMSKSPIGVFRHALVKGSPSAQVYALAILRRLDPQTYRFGARLIGFRRAHVELALDGCIMESVTLARIVSADPARHIELRAGESLAQWCRARPDCSVDLLRETKQLDLEGGSLSSFLLDNKL